MTLERVIAQSIEDDFTDRRGLRQAWEGIDEETQQEIRDKWTAIVRRVLASQLRLETPDGQKQI